MLSFTKTAGAGLLAASLLASSFTATPAQAGDKGAALAIGIATGLIVGGIVANAGERQHRRGHGGPQIYFSAGSPEPVCYPGPLKTRWIEKCRERWNGDLICHKTKQTYREQICY